MISLSLLNKPEMLLTAHHRSCQTCIPWGIRPTSASLSHGCARPHLQAMTVLLYLIKPGMLWNFTPASLHLQDMTTLSYLNEPGVLWNLKVRYQLDGIYTYTGSILIAVNPFQSLPLLYGGMMMEQYQGRPLGELSPHVYAIADAAYKQMMQKGRSQSILVSKPGAGQPQSQRFC